MAATFSDYLLDLLLNELDGQANRFDICSQNPANYAEATSTYTLGNSTSIQAGPPTDGDVSGRKVVFTAITDGTLRSKRHKRRASAVFRNINYTTTSYCR